MSTRKKSDPVEREWSIIAVGERYPLLSNMPGCDKSQYNYRQGEHLLELFMGSPTPEETWSTSIGQAEFALVTRGDVIALAFKLGAMEWSDAIYSYHLVPPHLRTLPKVGNGDRAFLNIYGVDRLTAKVTSRPRILTWSPEFSSVMHEAIRTQASREWPGQPAYEAQIRELYREFPHSRDIARTAEARCIGGS